MSECSVTPNIRTVVAARGARPQQATGQRRQKNFKKSKQEPSSPEQTQRGVVCLLRLKQVAKLFLNVLIMIFWMISSVHQSLLFLMKSFTRAMSNPLKGRTTATPGKGPTASVRKQFKKRFEKNFLY